MYNAAERVYLQSLTIDRRSAHQAELLLNVIFVKFIYDITCKNKQVRFFQK